MPVPAMRAQRVERGLQIPLLLYGFFLIALLVDVGGAFGLKYAAFAILSVYVLILITTNKISIPINFIVLELPLFIVAPIFYLFLANAIFSVPLANAMRELTPFATWLLYPLLLLIHPKERIISLFTMALFWGAVFTVIIFCGILLLDNLNQGDLIAKIHTFTSEYRLGYFGQRPFGNNLSAFFPNVYFRWTLLLIPAAILLLQGNKRQFIVVVLATLLTTSTAAILFLLIGIFWASFGNLLKGKFSRLYAQRFILFGIMLSIATLILYTSGYGHVAGFVVSKLSGLSASTSIKVGHIKSILALMSKDIMTLLFGTGVGSSFYSIGVNRIVTDVEADHFNLMRQFGILYSLGFFVYIFLLFFELRRLDRTGRLLSIGLMMLFIAAGTNPLLISPIFFLLLVISRAYISLYVREKRALKRLKGLTTAETPT
jgi:hypothetical protein